MKLPVTLNNESDTNPTVINKPDMRFATTFLSTKYRDYAVRGEAIMDKATGELLFRRPLDGRYVSFNQNKKYMHDLTLELRVLLTNYANFSYDTTSITGWYVSSDEDLVSLNQQKYVDILTTNTTIEESKTLEFKLSTNTNGFFCKPMSRDCDKAVIEYLTNIYDTTIRAYTGSDETFLQEQDKMNASGYYNANATLEYSVTVQKGSLSKTYEATSYIRINEEVLVEIPSSDIAVDYPEGYESILVTITGIKYNKIHFVMNHVEAFNGVAEGLTKFRYLDNVVNINYLNLMYFIDDSKDVVLNGTENLIAMLDIPYIQRYMGKMAKLKESSDIITTVGRPSSDLWDANTMWAERFRDIGENGSEVYLASESNFKDYERYFAKGNVSHIRISNDPSITTSAFSTTVVIDEEGGESDGE